MVEQLRKKGRTQVGQLQGGLSAMGGTQHGEWKKGVRNLPLEEEGVAETDDELMTATVMN